MHPEFAPERSSIRIRSSIQLLRSYLETFHPIEVSLWSGNDILGQTHIPLHKIVKPLQQKSGTDKTFDVLSEEFLLRLSAAASHEKLKASEDEESQPLVKIQVKLAREASTQEDKPNSAKQNRTRSNSVNHNSSTMVIDNENR